MLSSCQTVLNAATKGGTSLRVDALVVLLAAGIIGSGGCQADQGQGDLEYREQSKAMAKLDRWTRSLPNGEREEWEIKRVADGEYVRHGTYTRWHSNGQKASQATYRNGKLHGTYRFWDRHGKLMGEQRFRSGESIGE